MDYYKAVMITKVDIYIMETESPTLDRGDFMRMVCDTIDSKMEQTWRVRFHDDGKVSLYSFAIPQEKNLPAAECLNTAALPQWVRDRIAVLQICEQGDIIKGVGQKVSDQVFYVIE